MSVPVEKVLERAKASGFDAELSVADILTQAGWSVSQNVYYIDKDENKGREFDMYATYGLHDYKRRPEVSCRLYLCIEVKRTQDPFIFFSNPLSRTVEAGGGYSILHWSHNVDSNVLHWKKLEELRPFADILRIARSYMAFKDSKEQHIKSGVFSAFKAAVHMAEVADETYSETSRDICFFIPMLVVDGSIFECYFDNKGDLTASEVDYIVYRQNYLSETYGDRSVRVVVTTMRSLDDVCRRYITWNKDMIEAMKASREAPPSKP